MHSLYLLAAIIIAIIIWVIVSYNSLITLMHQVDNAWQQIDVQLKRRYDLIPNLVNTVKGAMEFEQETLTRVIEARAKAASAATPADKGIAEGILTQALGKLFALVEQYPDLKSNKNILQLQEELVSTENRIGFARQFYNDIAARFNIKQTVFPAVIIASLFNFKKAEYFQIEPSEKAVPKVDLGMKK